MTFTTIGRRHHGARTDARYIMLGRLAGGSCAVCIGYAFAPLRRPLLPQQDVRQTVWSQRGVSVWDVWWVRLLDLYTVLEVSFNDSAAAQLSIKMQAKMQR